MSGILSLPMGHQPGSLPRNPVSTKKRNMEIGEIMTTEIRSLQANWKFEQRPLSPPGGRKIGTLKT